MLPICETTLSRAERAPRRGVLSLPVSFDWAFIVFSIQKLLESASQPPFLATNVRRGPHFAA